MNEKEMIEEMAKDIFEYVDTKKQDNVYILHSGIAEDMKTLTHNYGLAEYLYKHGYRKIPEGSVVLDRHEHQHYCAYKIIEPQIRGCLDRERELEKQVKELEEQRDRQAYIAEELIQEKHRWTEQARKETARDILKDIKLRAWSNNADDNDNIWSYSISIYELKELAKQYGVEVEE